MTIEVLIRPIQHGYYVPIKTDAISCTYDMNGFRLMNAVLRAHGLDSEHFKKSARWHEGDKFKAISHGNEKPFLITTIKTPYWDSEPNATKEIIRIANIERGESLCMTHFAFILGAFPEVAFARCIRQALQATCLKTLKKIVVDVDERYFESAKIVYQQVNRQIVEAG